MLIAAILLSQVFLTLTLAIIKRLTEITRPALAIFGGELLFVPPLLALAEHREMPHPGIVIACIAGIVAGYLMLSRSFKNAAPCSGGAAGGAVGAGSAP